MNGDITALWVATTILVVVGLIGFAACGIDLGGAP